MEPIRVLIVESSPGLRDYLAELTEINGCRARCLTEKREFLTELERHAPTLVLLGPSNQVGQIRALSEVLEREKGGTPVLAVFDGNDTAEQEKVLDNPNVFYLKAGFDSDELKRAIEGVVQDSRDGDFKKLDQMIIGRNPAMLQLKKHAIRLAKSDMTILITGESGTGKELVARAIHKTSSRADKPFVKVNSAALPTNLLESELFGFEKGAFTGAYNKKPGKFELAHCGTILLDEIGEIPLPLQAKLLQVLQDNEYSALGSTVNTKVDSRVLAATNNDLTEMVSQGCFRADLYYRLNVVSLRVPPLRERKEDIGLLCEHFLRQYAERYNRKYRPLDPWLCEEFTRYSWPGNVRELESFIQSMTVLGHKAGFKEKMGNCARCHDFISDWQQTLQEVGPNMVDKRKPPKSRSLKKVCKRAVQKAETEAIMEVLFHTRWNRRKAADFLKVSYKALLNKIKEYDIEDRYKKSVRKDQTPDECYMDKNELRGD
jgi:two-component system response regulator AtoC